MSRGIEYLASSYKIETGPTEYQLDTTAPGREISFYTNGTKRVRISDDDFETLSFNPGITRETIAGTTFIVDNTVKGTLYINQGSTAGEIQLPPTSSLRPGKKYFIINPPGGDTFPIKTAGGATITNLSGGASQIFTAIDTADPGVSGWGFELEIPSPGPNDDVLKSDGTIWRTSGKRTARVLLFDSSFTVFVSQFNEEYSTIDSASTFNNPIRLPNTNSLQLGRTYIFANKNAPVTSNIETENTSILGVLTEGFTVSCVCVSTSSNGIEAWDISYAKDEALPDPLTVGKGGTGLTTSGPFDNVLTSNGTTWISQEKRLGQGVTVDGTQINMDLNTPEIQYIASSSAPTTFQLPNDLNVTIGRSWTFINKFITDTITISNSGSGALTTVPIGSTVTVTVTEPIFVATSVGWKVSTSWDETPLPTEAGGTGLSISGNFGRVLVSDGTQWSRSSAITNRNRVLTSRPLPDEPVWQEPFMNIELDSTSPLVIVPTLGGTINLNSSESKMVYYVTYAHASPTINDDITKICTGNFQLRVATETGQTAGTDYNITMPFVATYLTGMTVSLVAKNGALDSSRAVWAARMEAGSNVLIMPWNNWFIQPNEYLSCSWNMVIN